MTIDCFLKRGESIEAGTCFALAFICRIDCLSFGVSLTIEGKVLGIGPWDAFHYGLYMLLGLTVGQWAIIVGAVIVGLTSLFTKAWPKIGAVLNMLLIGIFIDFFTYILPDPETYISSTVVFVIGVILSVTESAFMCRPILVRVRATP